MVEDHCFRARNGLRTGSFVKQIRQPHVGMIPAPPRPIDWFLPLPHGRTSRAWSRMQALAYIPHP
jgi:hypothetical protein